MFDLTFRVPDSFQALLPEELKQYGPAVVAGLEAFVAALPPERRAAVVQDLFALGAGASVEEQLVAIARRCPTLHKLGQILARDPRLPESLRSLLRELESLPARPVDEELRLGILERTASPLGEVELEASTLAEGSVAVVVPFRWIRAVSGSVEEGVFKVHKPGAVAAIDEELDIWPEVGEIFARVCVDQGVAAPNSDDLFGRMREVLEREVDLERERDNLKAAGKVFRRDRRVRVPQVLPLRDRGLLAMTRLHGVPLGAATLDRDAARRTATELFEALVLRPLLQARDIALVHGDPHAGNLMVLDGERGLGLLDWSLAAELSKAERVLIVQAVLAGLLLDRRRLERSMTGLAEEVVDGDELRAAVAAAIRSVHRGRLPGVGWLIALIDDLVLRGAVRFPPNLLVLRKSWVALAGVLLELDPAFSVESALARQVVAQSLRELPRRWLSLPFSRGFSNHLSNFDLLRITASGPAFLRNFWREVMAES
ncbi:MAG: hypothetical protein DWQ36_15625 [Acidobacteria bacterium]|nr:MAG: hypothetical protein DWQ30_01550 [Acidobacteriota bacterium]REK05933.1 MAG: hypothetical protein DWQ36_15625 [Acidobacteriota bacterium]